MKLRKLHIEDYKMFKDFDIDFVDENDVDENKEPRALPIVVLAGVNGSGKTTLLEYLYNPEQLSDIRFISSSKVVPNIKESTARMASTYAQSGFLDNSSPPPITKDIDSDKSDTSFIKEIIKKSETEYNQKQDFRMKELYQKDVLYYSIDTTLENIKTLLPKYIENMIFVEGVAPFDAYQKVTDYINEILKDLDIQIEFDSRDGEGNLFFRNKNGGDKFSIDEVSTGEKTLLSKVLYLYLEDIKDKVILIDEPELSLHPSWQNKVLKIYENFAKQNTCQIIIATHSPQIIASADNESIRFLGKDEEGNIRAINDIQAYGRDIEWVLQQMGVKNMRVLEVLEKFTNCQQLLNDEKYDEAEACINSLEEEIGKNDRQVMNLRNSLFFERD